MIPEAGLRTPLNRSDWQTVRLKFLLERRSRPLNDDDGVVTAFRDGVVTLRSNRREEGFTFAEKEIGYQGVEPGDLVIHAMDGFAGAIGVSDSRGKCSPVCTIAVPRSDRVTHIRFWGYYLRNLAVTGFIESLAKGIRERSTDFRWKDAGNLLVNFPDIHAQERIADFLDAETKRIDHLIQKHARLTELIIERRDAMISAAVTGGSNAEQGWLYSLPSDWKAERAKLHFREKQERSLTGDEELLTVSHITGVTKRSQKDVTMFLAESHEGYKLVAPTDLVINTMWAWMGAMGVSSEEGLISPSYGVYRPISQELHPSYVDLLVRSRPFIAEATRRSKGIHSSRLRLYADAFMDMKLPVPPLAEQDRIVREVASQRFKEDLLIRKARAADSILKERRAALINAAVTGRIDIENWRKDAMADLNQPIEAKRT